MNQPPKRATAEDVKLLILNLETAFQTELSRAEREIYVVSFQDKSEPDVLRDAVSRAVRYWVPDGRTKIPSVAQLWKFHEEAQRHRRDNLEQSRLLGTGPKPPDWQPGLTAEELRRQMRKSHNENRISPTRPGTRNHRQTDGEVNHERNRQVQELAKAQTKPPERTVPVLTQEQIAAERKRQRLAAGLPMEEGETACG